MRNKETQTQSYEKLIFDALRMVTYKSGTGVLTNDALTKAVTLNENLASLGFTLKPNDIVKIASSPSVETLYDDISSMMSSVEAKPMYPDFPTQVMDMDEAQFRLHQIIHYFSTYGIEALTGESVSKGWLPADAGSVSDTEKTETDTRLLKATPVELVEEGDKFLVPFQRILSKNERMTDMEREIVKICASSGKIPFDKPYRIPFKENLEGIFCCIAETAKDENIDRKDVSNMLYNICQHPGDVTRGVHKYLVGNGYRLHTTEKKMFVDIYEKYSLSSFIENVTVSNKKTHFTQEIFNRIDFKKYAHDPQKIQAVKDIAKLHTWESKARKKIENKDPDAVRFASTRPGMLIRMLSMVLRNGYTEEETAKALNEKSGSISVQTTVSLINKLRQTIDDANPVGYAKRTRAIDSEQIKAKRAAAHPANKGTKRDIILSRIDTLQTQMEKLNEKEKARSSKKKETKNAEERILMGALRSRLEKIDTGLQGKKLYLDEETYAFDNIPVNPAEKNAKQGYLPSATVVKIPEKVKRIRCFTYWNDKRRVDLDLHVSAVNKDGGYVHIGWNGEYDKSGVVFSGDITHSDAAEYVDIDLENTDARHVKMSLHSYTGQKFSDIETCYTGMMAVDRIGQDVKLYDPANCFFSNDIRNECTAINYGEIDVENRRLSYFGVDRERADIYMPPQAKPGMFSLKEYLCMLSEAQGSVLVDSPEEADCILTLCKPATEKDVSLIDNNYFFDALLIQEEKEE